MWRSRRRASRDGGGFALVALLAALPTRAVPATILFALSGLGLVWALFLAPVWCGAVTKEGRMLPKQLLGCCLAAISTSTGGRSSK